MNTRQQKYSGEYTVANMLQQIYSGTSVYLAGTAVDMQQRRLRTAKLCLSGNSVLIEQAEIKHISPISMEASWKVWQISLPVHYAQIELTREHHFLKASGAS